MTAAQRLKAGYAKYTASRKVLREWYEAELIRIGQQAAR